MKRKIVFATLVAVFVFGGLILAQQTDKSKKQANRDWSDGYREMMDRCLRMRNQSSMMGSGMMRGMGKMMGREMMRRGMMGKGMMSGSKYRPNYQQSESGSKLSQPLDKKGAVELVSEYIQSLNNPRLKVGNVEEKDKYFIAEIVTKKEGALVEKVKVEKDTGWLKPADEK